MLVLEEMLPVMAAPTRAVGPVAKIRQLLLKNVLIFLL